MSEKTCSSCHADFDIQQRAPRILPSCGHTFCSACLTDWLVCGETGIPCPEDRVVFVPSDRSLGLALFPINFALINLLRKKGEATAPQQSLNCVTHKKPLNMVCIDDRVPICTDCALFDEHRGHVYRRNEDFVAECRTSLQTLRTDRDFNRNQGLGEIEKRVALLRTQIDERQERLNATLAEQVESVIAHLRLRERETRAKIADNFSRYSASVANLNGLVGKARERDDKTHARLKRLEAAVAATPPELKLLLDGMHGEDRVAKEVGDFTDQLGQIDQESHAVIQSAMNAVQLKCSLAPVLQALDRAFQVEDTEARRAAEPAGRSTNVSKENSAGDEKALVPPLRFEKSGVKSKETNLHEGEEEDNVISTVRSRPKSRSDSSVESADGGSDSEDHEVHGNKSIGDSVEEYTLKELSAIQPTPGKAFVSPDNSMNTRPGDKTKGFDFSRRHTLANPNTNLLKSLDADLGARDTRQKATSLYMNSSLTRTMNEYYEDSANPMLTRSFVLPQRSAEESFDIASATRENNAFRKTSIAQGRGSINTDTRKADRQVITNPNLSMHKVSESRANLSLTKPGDHVPDDSPEVDLSNRKINDARLANLLPDLAKNKRLKVLNLDFNLISEIGFNLLVKKLADHPSLERVSLVDNYLDESVFRVLKDNAKKLKNLHRFVLRENRQFKNIASIKKEVAALKKLGISIEVSF